MEFSPRARLPILLFVAVSVGVLGKSAESIKRGEDRERGGKGRASKRDQPSKSGQSSSAWVAGDGVPQEREQAGTVLTSGSATARNEVSELSLIHI